MKKINNLANRFTICLSAVGIIFISGFLCNVAFVADVEPDFETCQAYPLGPDVQPVPGNVYYWEEAEGTGLDGITDTIYLAGNLPLLITVPHGGSFSGGVDLPNRSINCGTISNDAFTMKLAYELMLEIKYLFNGYPHMILNRLSRTKIDQSRRLNEDCNPDDPRGVKAWNDFHVNFKKKAVDTILLNHDKGLYIDLHGKPDNYGSSVHIGYHLTSNDLWYSDKSLNNEDKRFIDDSSIRFLYKNMNLGLSQVLFTDLLREDHSFGTILHGYVRTIQDPTYSFTVSPRTEIRRPFPYYSGGYNVLHFTGGTQSNTDYNTYEFIYNNAPYSSDYNETKFMSGFQLETGYRIRDNHSLEYANMLASAIKDYMDLNYGN